MRVTPLPVPKHGPNLGFEPWLHLWITQTSLKTYSNSSDSHSACFHVSVSKSASWGLDQEMPMSSTKSTWPHVPPAQMTTLILHAQVPDSDASCAQNQLWIEPIWGQTDKPLHQSFRCLTERFPIAPKKKQISNWHVWKPLGALNTFQRIPTLLLLSAYPSNLPRGNETPDCSETTNASAEATVWNEATEPNHKAGPADKQLLICLTGSHNWPWDLMRQGL